MPDEHKAAVIRKSKLGTELTEPQSAVLSDLVSISEYPDGEVVVADRREVLAAREDAYPRAFDADQKAAAPSP